MTYVYLPKGARKKLESGKPAYMCSMVVAPHPSEDYPFEYKVPKNHLGVVFPGALNAGVPDNMKVLDPGKVGIGYILDEKIKINARRLPPKKKSPLVAN